MAQPTEYTYSGAFIPGTLARAEAVGLEFTSVQNGFAALAIQGVDSGTANAYVVTTSGGKNGTYSDGMIVEFKATNSNTGGSTIAVDSGSTVSITTAGGVALSSGAITANTWYRLVYNSTYSAFTLVAPTTLTTTSNTISNSAPTHLVGLTPAGGSSTACAPIDVTFAIDQSISPTWTGTHTFAGTVNFNSVVNFTGGLTLTGLSNQYAITLDGNSGAGHSFGLEVNAGTNSSDVAMLVNNQAGSTAYFEIIGSGSVIVGNPTGGGQGVGTINATGLFVNGVAVSNAVSHNPTATIGLSAVSGTAATFMTSDSAPPLSQAIVPTWTGAHTWTPSSAVIPVTINAQVNTVGLKVVGNTNTAGAYAAEIVTGLGSGFSSGLLIEAGTTSADSALEIVNAAASTIFAQIYGDGEFMITAPTAATNQSTNFSQVGYMDAPLNQQTTSYQIVMTDRGKMIQMNGATLTLTIPANASVAFPQGTVITVIVLQTLTVSITSDTLQWLPSLATGSRTVAAGSVITLYKRLSTTWNIWGFGIT